MDNTTTPAQAPEKGAKTRYFVLLLLVLVYTLNFLDRQVLSILKDSIKLDLHLTDAQLGWMGGVPFALFYCLFGIPAAWLADRTSRVWIVTGALTLWSGFTAFCGLATNLTQLSIGRMGVGIGEAGGVAPAYSLISDYFSVKSRARALAIFSLGIPLGSAAGVLFGGLIAAHVNWRYAFLVIGAVGVGLAPMFRLLVRDPKRKTTPGAVQPSLWSVAKLAAAKPSFWFLSTGSASASMVGYGVMYWMPTFLARSLKMDLISRSQLFAGVLLIGGVIGVALGGVLADKLGQKSKRAYALIPAGAFLIAAPLYALGVLAKTPHEAFWLFLVPQALGLVWLGPVLTAVQHLAPSNSRSVMSSLFLLINNLLGIALGTYAFGALSDWLKPHYGLDSLKYAFLYALGFYGLAGVLLIFGSFSLKKDWIA